MGQQKRTKRTISNSIDRFLNGFETKFVPRFLLKVSTFICFFELFWVHLTTT